MCCTAVTAHEHFCPQNMLVIQKKNKNPGLYGWVWKISWCVQRSYCLDSSDINTDMPLKTDELKLLCFWEEAWISLYSQGYLDKVYTDSFEKTKSFFSSKIICGQSSLISYLLPSCSKMSSSRNVKWLSFHSIFYNKVDLKSCFRGKYSNYQYNYLIPGILILINCNSI